jgi:hypothetical protein
LLGERLFSTHKQSRKLFVRHRALFNLSEYAVQAIGIEDRRRRVHLPVMTCGRHETLSAAAKPKEMT